jgi:hypothetical protein
LLYVEGDASSASYFLAAGAIAGGPVRVEGVGKSSIQGDVRFVEALESMGAHITMGDSWIEVRSGGVLKAIDADYASFQKAISYGFVAKNDKKIEDFTKFLSNYKTKAGLVYVMAAIAAKEKGLDDLFLANDKGNILETSCCNIFIVSNGVLYTPGLDEGCLAGTMRMQIINIAIANGIKVYECTILPQNLLAADEIFVTNAIRGINWIGGYRTKRYFNNMSRKLVVLLNDYWERELGI